MLLESYERFMIIVNFVEFYVKMYECQQFMFINCDIDVIVTRLIIQMDFSNISILHSHSQSSLYQQVGAIHQRLHEAENRLRTLQGVPEQNHKFSSKNNSIYTERLADTKRSLFSHKQTSYAMERDTLPLKVEKEIYSKENVYKKQIQRLEEMLVEERINHKESIKKLHQNIKSKQITIQSLKKKQLSRDGKMRQKSQYEQNVIQQNQQLKHIISVQKSKTLNHAKEKQIFCSKLKRLESQNINLQSHIESVLKQTNAEQKSNRQQLQVRCQLLEQQLLRTRSQLNNIQSHYSSYKNGLLKHHKQCFMISELMVYTSQVLGRFKTIQIPATAVMIREQLSINMATAHKIIAKIKELHPDIEKQRQLCFRAGGMTGRRFISDDKENMEINNTSGEVVVKNKKMYGFDEDVMCMLLIQAQQIQQHYF